MRAHEQAHLVAAGRYASSGGTFPYETGSDYAVGGEVAIDTSAIAGDPEATLRKMEQIRRAALAPANPSGQDRMVAEEASRAAAKARRSGFRLTSPRAPGDTLVRPADQRSPGTARPSSGGKHGAFHV